MPTIRIDDLDDPRLAMYRHLKATNDTRDAGQFVVEGEKLFDRLLGSRFPLASVLTTERLASAIGLRVPDSVPHFVVPEPSIAALVGFNFHRGVLACGRRVPWPPLAEQMEQIPTQATVLVCPRIDNPENLGAILRIADVFGVDALIVGPRCPDPLSRRVLRVSMGSALGVPVITSGDLAVDCGVLRERMGFECVATVLDPAAERLDGFRRPDRLALFLGSEGHGLEPEWLALCNRFVTISMRAGAESLNVAVAAGILLHHLGHP